MFVKMLRSIKRRAEWMTEMALGAILPDSVWRFPLTGPRNPSSDLIEKK